MIDRDAAAQRVLSHFGGTAAGARGYVDAVLDQTRYPESDDLASDQGRMMDAYPVADAIGFEHVARSRDDDHLTEGVAALLWIIDELRRRLRAARET